MKFAKHDEEDGVEGYYHAEYWYSDCGLYVIQVISHEDFTVEGSCHCYRLNQNKLSRFVGMRPKFDDSVKVCEEDYWKCCLEAI